MRAVVAIVAAMALAGCSTAPQRVLVPVSVPCKVDAPKPPVWATGSLRAESGIWEQVKALLAERQQRIGYEKQLEAAIAACQPSAPGAPLNQ